MSVAGDDAVTRAAGATLSVVGFSDQERTAGAALGSPVTAEAAATGEGPVLALYRAPWEAFLDARPVSDGHRAWLAGWCRFHRGLLSLHRSAPDRVLLVNAGRLRDPDALPRHLGGLGIEVDPGATATIGEPATEAVLLHPWIAAALAGTGSEAWEVYEELESCSLLLDRDPEFQATIAMPDLADPQAFLAAFASLRDEIRQSLDALRDQVSENRDAAMLAREAAAVPSPVDESLRQENELLSLQLQQVLEELHYHMESGKSLRALLLQSGDTAEAARLLISELAKRDAAPA